MIKKNKTPHFINPGDLSEFINFTGISNIYFDPSKILIKSICIASSEIGS